MYKNVQFNADNLYIDMIEFGITKICEGIIKQDLQRYLKEKGYKYTGDEYIFKENFGALYERQLHDSIPESSNTKYSIRTGAYFNYFQYKQYVHAINEAKNARYYSNAALIFSGLSFLGSIVFFICQLSAEITINQKQMNQLIKSSYNSSLICPVNY